MPTNSLLDLFGPRDIGGNATGFGDMLAQRSNSLIGLGLGLMSGTAQDPYGNAMRGYAQGASSDQDRYQSAQALAERRAARAQSMAEHRMDRAQAQKNWEQQFQRSGESDFDRMQRDIQKYGADTPEGKQIRDYYASKLGGGPPHTVNAKVGDEDVTYQWDAASRKYVPFQAPDVTSAAAPSPFDTGPGPGVGYTSGGVPSPTPPGTAGTGAPGQPPVSRRMQPITGATGIVYQPPAGLSKDAHKAWANHVAATEAKIASGEMTEGQAKYSIYATGMEIAQRELQGLEGQGTSQMGKRLSQIPGGLGAYLQTPEYQNYRNAKDAWLNAKLRAESGATINPDEFARDERIYFPQPGEDAEAVAAKAKLREHITKKMTKAGGPGYTPPPPLAAPSPASAPTSGAPASSGTPPSGRAIRWGRDAKGNPVPLP